MLAVIVPSESCQDLNNFLSDDNIGIAPPPRLGGSLKLSISTEPLGAIDVSSVFSITVDTMSQAPSHREIHRVSGQC